MTIRDEIIDELLAGQDAQAVFAEDGLLETLKKATSISRARRAAL